MSQNDCELLVVDIDGTLVGADRIISDADKEALAEVYDSGVKVSLSTGRALMACAGIFRQLTLDGYHVFFDGALVTDLALTEQVYIQPISPDLLRRAVEFVHQHDICLELFSADRYFVERETWLVDIRRRFFGVEPVMADFTQLGEEQVIIKAGLTTSTAEEADKAMSFYHAFNGSLGFSWAKTPAYPDVHFINIVSPEVSKGRALETLASYLGIPLSRVMAIGDGTNDISLLTSAGLAVAMGNAPAEVKAVADYVTLDVDHSGVAAAINRFLL